MASAPRRFLVAVCLPVCVVLARDCEGSCGAADATLLHQRSISRSGLSTVGDPLDGSGADGTVQISPDNVGKLLLSTQEQVEQILTQPPVPDLATEDELASPSEVQWDAVQNAVQDASKINPDQLFELPEVQALPPQVQTVMKHTVKSAQKLIPKMGTAVHQELAKWEEWSKDPKLESMLMKVAERLGVANGDVVPMDDAERIMTDMIAEVPALATYATRPRHHKQRTNKSAPDDDVAPDEPESTTPKPYTEFPDGLKVGHLAIGGVAINLHLSCTKDSFACITLYFKVVQKSTPELGFPAGITFQFKHVAMNIGAYSVTKTPTPAKFTGGFEFGFKTKNIGQGRNGTGTSGSITVQAGPKIQAGKGVFDPKIAASVSPPDKSSVAMNTRLEVVVGSNKVFAQCTLVKMEHKGGTTKTTGIGGMMLGYDFKDSGWR